MRPTSIAAVLALLATMAGAVRAAPPEATSPASQVATQTDADPLTPKVEAKPPPAAPAANAEPAKPSTPAAERHPAIAALMERLSGLPAPDQETLTKFYGAHGQPLWTSPTGLSARGASALAEFAKAADYGLDSPTAYRVPETPGNFADAGKQAEHELAVSLVALTYARHARGGRLDPTRISAMIDMKPEPYDPVSVLEALAQGDDAGATLRGFHPKHEGFRRLQAAYAAARAQMQPADKLARIQINLERWRWMPDDLGNFHVANNVPEQLTRVYKDGRVVFTEKIVVGKPGHSTPLMSANMQFVIFHPSWGVPNGIKTNEVAPMLKRASARNDSLFAFGEGGGRASAALARHELRAYHNGREVNPDSIDWRTVDIRQFHFTQPPSNKNVLGVVKFRFPNKYDVYMHDTQEKNLFAQNVRAYSHGCMRVQNPLALAEVILGHDRGWTMERVQAAVKSGRSQDVTLETPVPVHLTYFTATADDTGKVSYHGDIYGMDTRVASALAGKPVALAAAAVPSQASAPRRSQRSRTRDAEPWNPFAGLLSN
jgi:murein L,D-transpeptidase YcbB/YkuD